MTREQIIQNIKTRISTIESYSPDEYALNEGNLFELKDLLLMIEKDEPSLPSNLDEVRLDTSDMIDCGYKAVAEYYYNLGKKAGAEWMAKQGETQEHFVIGSIAGSYCGPAIVCYTKEFAIGDEVIVQIRKKEE